MLQSHSPRDAQYHQVDLLGVAPGAPGAHVEFADIPHSAAQGEATSSLLHPDTTASDSLPLPAASSAASVSGGIGSAASSNASFYQLAYYQSWFDVTSAQMASRLLRALLPFRGKFYSDADPTPDLYGPFWIATTLIFLLAAAGNFANYIQFIVDARRSGSYGDDTTQGGGNGTATGPPSDASFGSLLVWKSDFAKLSTAASVFYAWISLVPALVYCAFARVGREAGAPQKGLVEIASLFGYSLLLLLPVCLLCIPPIALLRWCSVAVAFAGSTFFLVRNLGADIHNAALLPVLGAIVALNLGVALLTKFYFFDF